MMKKPKVSKSKGSYEVLWPRGKKAVEIMPLAKRLDTLSGKTIGELWDWVFRGDEIFPILEEELAKRYPGIKFVSYKVFGPTHGGKEAEVVSSLPQMLIDKKCDAVISGVGA